MKAYLYSNDEGIAPIGIITESEDPDLYAFYQGFDDLTEIPDALYDRWVKMSAECESLQEELAKFVKRKGKE